MPGNSFLCTPLSYTGDGYIQKSINPYLLFFVFGQVWKRNKGTLRVCDMLNHLFDAQLGEVNMRASQFCMFVGHS